LEHAFNDRLVSVILYGSAAPGGSADRLSDFNILCVLKEVTLREIADGESVLAWWEREGQHAPLLMGEHELWHAVDSFPMEFRDMRDLHKVLYGIDVISDLPLDTRHYRAQVEHELRAKLLRLRQRGACLYSKPEELLALCLKSVSTFCVLGRHALLLAESDAPTARRGIVMRLGHIAGLNTRPFEILLDLRTQEGTHVFKDISGGVHQLFAEYLEATGTLVRFVDSLSGSQKKH